MDFSLGARYSWLFIDPAQEKERARGLFERKTGRDNQKYLGRALLPANSNQHQHDLFHWSTKKGVIKEERFFLRPQSCIHPQNCREVKRGKYILIICLQSTLD